MRWVVSVDVMVAYMHDQIVVSVGKWYGDTKSDVPYGPGLRMSGDSTISSIDLT